MKLQFNTLNILTVNVTLNNKVRDYNFSMLTSQNMYIKTQQEIVET